MSLTKIPRKRAQSKVVEVEGNMEEDLAHFDYKETALFTLSEIILPTADVYTDFVLAFRLLTISYDKYATQSVLQCFNQSWAYVEYGCYINASYVVDQDNCNDPPNICCLGDPFSVPQNENMLYLNCCISESWYASGSDNLKRSIDYMDNSKETFPLIGYAMCGTILLSTITQMISLWSRSETAFRFEFFLVTLQIWPQYRAMRILWLRFVKKDLLKTRQERRDFEHNLNHVGK